MKIRIYIALILVFSIFCTSIEAAGPRKNKMSGADPLGQFINNLENPQSIPKNKTKVDSRDTMAQFLVEKKIVEKTDIEFIKPNSNEIQKMKSEYILELGDILKKNQVVFSTLERGDSIEFYNSSDCLQSKKCSVMKLSEAPLRMTTTGQYKIQTQFDEYNYPDFNAYLEVDYIDSKTGNHNKAWMAADDLSTLSSKKGSIYRSKSKPSVKAAQVKCFDRDDESQSAFDIEGHTTQSLEERNTALDSLSGKVGQCLLKKPKQTVQVQSGLVYDQIVLPALNKSASGIKNLSPKQVKSINAVALTLYAEMGRCVSKGLQYPLAVARVMYNRAQYEEKKMGPPRFINAKTHHDVSKEYIDRVVTEPSQFSAWLRKLNGRPNPSLMHLLCPPSGDKNFFWNSQDVPDYERRIWKNILKISYDMILHPAQFEARTRSLSDVYYYTSGAARIKGITSKVQRAVDGQSISLSSCINLYNDDPRR